MSDPAVPPPSARPARRRVARVLVPVAAVAIAVGGFAIAEAATDSGVDTPQDLAERASGVQSTPNGVVTTTSTSEPITPAVTGAATRTEASDFVILPDGTTQTFAAGVAGSVTIARSGGTLAVVAVDTNAPWVTEIEQASGPEVEVGFRNGTARIDLEAEFEAGAVRVRVRERTDGVDDDDDGGQLERDDSSGPGRVSSGHGDDGNDGGGDGDDGDHDDDHDDDRDDDRDDNSGSGSSGSGSSGSGRSGSDD